MVGSRPAGRVISVTSETVKLGDTAFFDSWSVDEKRAHGSKLGTMAGLKRYGSSKLMMDVTMYHMREKLLSVSCHSIAPDSSALEQTSLNEI